ncbi:Kinesin-like protein [Rhynchospora pubera]|uniref:Kinesin-like protein n=1 Tax=Rhynchospora pubera TaxID=906938 RepID=A0AAV8EYT8_9POAL|nr:Kinesin-like protein [Rhynchospora pubera]
MGSRQEKEKAVNVQVILRCRPFNDDELRTKAPQVVTCDESNREVSVTQSIAGKPMDRVFTFDKVFGPNSKQKDLYNQAVIPIVNEVLEGFNCTIFAYGQTGTGKTYTMEGECRRTKAGSHGQLPPDAGVIPRAVKQIFDTLESQNAEYSVKVTFLELYNEEITDLLAPEELSKIALEERQKKPLPLMEDGKGGVLVKGLEEEIVTNCDEIFTLLERGSAKRRTAETLLNKQSSRSHSLFSITIHIKEATPEGEELIKCGKLNLVDLAGSENISRSGARDGRAREAGEINKSLLTLGRVITALVEHLGHIPYRDSKLTRLLRDSLGGRTKTCIIATVSPSVHCLEETLSTLDYAHRAKSIKNRPEVNQKMMKSALIKDLYSEIDRLKVEVYAAREKVGVYIPKDRYDKEEAERKAMTEQIEQMGTTIETHQKEIEDLKEKYNSQLENCGDLTKRLEATEKTLDHTTRLLSSTKEELKQAHYNIKEKDFIISKQIKAENALTNQACVLRSDLEKSTRENASLFSKIAREDKVIATNRSVVNSYQTDLNSKLGFLSKTLVQSIEQQNQHLKSIEAICNSCLNFHDKAVSELRTKVLDSKTLYMSHVEGIENVVRLHKSTTNASLEEMASVDFTNHSSLKQMVAGGLEIASNILIDMEKMLSSHRADIASFMKELRERFQASVARTKETSILMVDLFNNLLEEKNLLQLHSTEAHDTHVKSIADFQKAYEEQSMAEEEMILANVTNLVSGLMRRQRELVGVRLNGLGEAALETKMFVEKHCTKVDGVTNETKRKWEEFAAQSQHDSTDNSDFTAAKHCRLEALLEKCAKTIDSASEQLKQTEASVSELSTKQVSQMEDLVRNTMVCNEHHIAEVTSARAVADEEVANISADILAQIQSLKEHEKCSISGLMSASGAHSQTILQLKKEHSDQTKGIIHHTDETFRTCYKDYEATGETPVRSESEIPSKVAIESLRALPMDALIDEFRENHPYEFSKEPKPTMIPRSPLIQLNGGK